MAVILRTERLILRELTPDDAEAAYRMRSEPEIIRYTGDPPVASVAEARRDLIAYPDYREHGFGRWACVFEGAVVGFCGLKYLPERDEVDLGYRLFPEVWGRGLATEAARACVEHGFGPLGLSRIIALVMPVNVASARVVEKCGLTLEGRTMEGDDEALLYAAERG